MDGDGINDFEIYETNPTSGTGIPVTNTRKISDLNLVDPENPAEANPGKGYMTAYKADSACATWNEEKDYLYPIPQAQIDLTGGALEQNPGW